MPPNDRRDKEFVEKVDVIDQRVFIRRGNIVREPGCREILLGIGVALLAGRQ